MPKSIARLVVLTAVSLGCAALVLRLHTPPQARGGAEGARQEPRIAAPAKAGESQPTPRRRAMRLVVRSRPVNA